jgi:hypothetical protein
VNPSSGAIGSAVNHAIRDIMPELVMREFEQLKVFLIPPGTEQGAHAGGCTLKVAAKAGIRTPRQAHRAD